MAKVHCNPTSRFFRILLALLYHIIRDGSLDAARYIKRALKATARVFFCFKYAEDDITPRSVNYHFTRRCNYSCGFCFHTAKTSFVLPLDESMRGLMMLRDAGMEKINFSGGEPFIEDRGKRVGEMVKFCKETLELESVTIVTNGSMVKKSWFEKYGKYLDIMAVSCDSFDESTNKCIGRGQGSRNHLEKLLQIRYWCEAYKVLFKLNTVVNTFNALENMNAHIMELNPYRWKVFQCLLIEGENAGEDALRNAEQYYISDKIFQYFIDRHKDLKCLVPEPNDKMRNSYLILDEYMRFLDCTSGEKVPSKSLLDVGVENALKFSGFDERMFYNRGGEYKWTKVASDFEW